MKATFKIPNNSLKRYDIQSRWSWGESASVGATGLVSIGKWVYTSTWNGESNVQWRYYGGLVPVTNYNIDHNKYRITKVKLSFDSSYIAHTMLSLPVYFGCNSIANLMKNWGVGDNLGERVNLANDSSWHLSSYETNTCTFNSYSLKAFQDYFWPTKTIVIYTPEDRDFMPDSGEGDSPNFANFENFILEVEYEPKAASFLTLPSELIINSQNQVTVGTLGEGFTYKLRLELGSQFLETEEFSEQSPTFHIPEDWGKEIPMAYRATGKLSLITYLDEEEIGTHTIPMDYTVPKYNLNDINLKITDETSYYKKIEGQEQGEQVYLSDLSKIKIDFVQSSAEKYGAKIISKTITYYQSVFIDNAYTEIILSTEALKDTNIFTLNESGRMVIEVIDSRNVTKRIELPYIITKENLPSLTDLTIDRCYASGKYANLGENIRIQGNLQNGTIELKSRDSEGNYKDQIDLNFIQENLQQGESPYWLSSGDKFTNDSAHYFKLTVFSLNYFADRNFSSPMTLTYYLQISSSAYLIHFLKNGRGLGFGCAADTEEIDRVTFGWRAAFKQGIFLSQALNAQSGGTGFNSILGLWNHISSLTYGEGQNDNYLLNFGFSNLEATSLSIKPVSEPMGQGETETDFYSVYPMKIVDELPEIGTPGVVYFLKK